MNKQKYIYEYLQEICDRLKNIEEKLTESKKEKNDADDQQNSEEGKEQPKKRAYRRKGVEEEAVQLV